MFRATYSHVYKRKAEGVSNRTLSERITFYQQYLVLCTVFIHKFLNLWITGANSLNSAGLSAMI